MSQRVYPQYPQQGASYPPTSSGSGYPGQAPSQLGTHPYPVPPSQSHPAPPSSGEQMKSGGVPGHPPAGILPLGQGRPPGPGGGVQAVGQMTNAVNQMNLGPPGLSGVPLIPTATPLSSAHSTPSQNVALHPQSQVPSQPLRTEMMTGPPLNIGPPPPTSNIGPPPQPGQVYRAPLSAPPPMIRPQQPQAPGQLQPSSSGERLPAPVGAPTSGGQYQPLVSGVPVRSVQPPVPPTTQLGSGGHYSPPTSTSPNQGPPGGQTQPPPPVLGAHQMLNQPTFLPPASEVQAQGQGAPRVGYPLSSQPPVQPPTSAMQYPMHAPPIKSSAPPTSGMPTSAISTTLPPVAPPTGSHPPGPPIMSSTQMGVFPTGFSPMGPPTSQMGAPTTGPLSRGPPMSSSQMGVPPTGPPPTGHPMMSSSQMGAPPMGPLPVSPPTSQMGVPLTGPPPVGHPTSQMGAPPTGPPSMGPPPTGATPTTGLTGRVSHPLSGQPAHSGSGLPAGPPGMSVGSKQPSSGLTGGPGPGGVSGQPHPGLGQGPSGMMPLPSMPSGSNAEGFNTTDPFLQPVNLLEQRNILPPEPLEPPPIVLPGGQSKYAPDHRVFCCTMNAVPATNSLLSKLKLPLAVHLHPYKDMSTKECPVIHPSIIVRCRSCRAYINPYVTFIDSRHWRCNLCFRANTLPEDFDIAGQQGDRSHRMEVKRSCIEYIAPSEYMVRPPQPCVYYFVVDVSFTSIDSGVLAVFCRSLLDHLERLPGDARTLVGLLTFDSSLHFYSFPSTDSPPQMMVVSDIDDVFLPCPESLLVNLRQYKEIFRSLLEDLPRMFSTNQSDRSALGPALQAATKLLHPIGGRITAIQCSLPNAGPGALKYRDVAPSTTKLPTLNMAPASDFYKSLALDCNAQQISIDLFGFSGQFMDLATMSCVAKFSSGQVFHYSDFHHSRQAAKERFQKDFKRYLTRKIGFEAVMRIRCTDGMSLHTFHGNFFVRSTDLLSLPCVNPDLGYTINISIDDNLKEFGSVCFQAALLYTSSRGERRIRVHTLCVPVSDQLAHIYARLNVQAIAGTLANMGVDRATNATLGDAREALMNTVIDSGKLYRSNVASSRQSSQFALPASIRLLPLFIIALLKSLAFTLSSKVSYDRRTQAMNQIKCMPLDYLLLLLYPRLYAVHMMTENDIVETDGGNEELRPPILQLSAEKLNRYGVYLMDYGLGLYLWVCKDASQEYLSKILDVKHFGAIPEIMCELPSLKNDCSKLLCKLVRQIRFSRQYVLPVQVIREDGPHRLLFIEKLVDDRTDLGTSYYELLSHIARQQSK